MLLLQFTLLAVGEAGWAGDADPVMLRALVDELPTTTVADEAKRAVLEVALERVDRLQAQDRSEEAGDLLADVRAALQVPTALLSARNPQARQIGSLFPVRVTKGNPYIEWIRAGLGKELEQRDEFQDPASYTRHAFGDEPGNANGTLAVTCETLFWSYVNPASPFVGNAEVLRRFLRRAHFYLDGVDRLAGIVLERKRGFIDEFSLGPALAPLREFAELHPRLLLPSQRRQWDSKLRHVAQAQLQDFGRFDGSYPNIDIARGFQLFNLGRHLHDQDLLDKAQAIIRIQRKNVYADGGIAYIGQQNAQQGYQYTAAVYLARYYEATGDPVVLDILAASQWYGPVCGRFPEWWTASAWKGMWNNSMPDIGGEFVACVSGNPYLYGMRGSPTLADMVVHKWRDARTAVAWYRNDVQPQPLPDNYTAIDRNIMGPRAYYGGFTYAANLRDITVGPGHATVMGCLHQGEGKKRSIIPRIAPEVLIADAKGKVTPAWITSDLRGAMSIGRHFSVVSGRYSPATNKSSSKGVVVPWDARQLWLGLPDRLIGMMTIAPEQERAEANGINALVRCAVGGPKDQVVKVADDRYRYQDFDIIIHQHNFRSISLVNTPARFADSFSSDIVCHVSDLAGSAKRVFRRDEPHVLIVEIKVRSAVGEAVVEPVAHQEGLLGLEVKLPGRRFTMWMNPTGQDRTVSLVGGPHTCVHPSGVPPVGPIVPAPDRIAVPAFQHVVEVMSQEPTDHLPGWASLQDMLGFDGKPPLEER